MAQIRINKESGRIEKQSFGFLGSSWIDVNEESPVRVDPDTGKIQRESFGIFGSTWNDVDTDKEVRVNPDNGKLEQRSGIFGSWNQDEDLDVDDD